MRNFLAVCYFIFIGNICIAQQYFGATQETFGKNRVQYKRFEWKSIQSQNFIINYYRSGDDIAKQAAQVAETEFDRITSLLGYTPFTRMQLYLYNSPKELAQSNIGLTSPVEYEGGIMNLARSRVELAYTGNPETFRAAVVEQIGRLFVYDMLYGGSLKEVLQTSLLLTVPEWYMAGIARYISVDANLPDERQRLTNAVQQLQQRKLSSLKGEEAALIGHSIWYYIAQRYGEQNIANILNLTRIIRMEESSITSTLGLSFTRFLREWRNFYGGATASGEPAAATPIAKQPEKPTTMQLPTTVMPSLPNLLPHEVDTENYAFDSAMVAAIQQKQLTDSVKTSQQPVVARRAFTTRTRSGEAFSAPKAYQNLLVSNGPVLEPLIDPLRRFGAKATISLNDLLEQHVLKFMGFITPNFKNHDFGAEYKNYKSRLDWGLRFDRRSIFYESIEPRNYFLFRPYGLNFGSITPTQPITIYAYRRLVAHQVQADFSYPISNNLRVVFQPFFTTTSELAYAEQKQSPTVNNYAGGKAEIVFDNTRVISSAIRTGTRAKIRAERWQGLGNQRGFDRLWVDARHYQPLVRGLQLAGRFSYGLSGGQMPRYTFLGGTENWINRSYHRVEGQAATPPTSMEHLYFYNFAGSLRGFTFGRLAGTHHILTNLELRLSLARFLFRGNVQAKILQNLQLIAFNDVGTAWVGSKGPFSKQNSLNTEVVGGGNNPFYAVVTNYKNPFLMGYGIGARTMLLGYLIRADYAWGKEDGLQSKPILHLSIGHDF